MIVKAELCLNPYIKYGEVVVKQGDRVLCITDEGIEKGLVVDFGFNMWKEGAPEIIRLLQSNEKEYEFKEIDLENIRFMTLDN